MKRRNDLALCAIIFGAALLPRLAFILQLRASPYFDFPILDPLAYHEWALRIARGDWLGQHVFRQAPLYPYSLALLYKAFGPNLLAVRLIQMLMGSLSCVLIYRIGAACFDRRTGVIAGLISCLYAPFVFYEGMIIKTSLGIFLNLLLVTILIRCRSRGRGPAAFLAGVLLGLSALIRENILILAPVLAVWLAATAGKARSGLILLCGVLLVIAPVTARNYRVSREFVPIACNFGFTLYSGNNPGADGTQQPPPDVRRTPEFEYPDYRLLAEKAAGRRLGPTEVSSFWAGQVKAFAGTYPLAEAKLLLRKFALFWNAYEIADNHNLYFFKNQFPVLRLLPLGFGLIGPLAILGMALSVRRWRRCLILYLFVLSYMVSVVVFYVSARFRLPSAPYLIIFASGSAVSIYDCAAGRRWGQLLFCLVAVVLLFVIVNAPLYPPIGFDAEYYNLAETYKRAGRLEEAAATYRKAIEINPHHAAAYNNLGGIYDLMGLHGEAVEAFRMATKIRPDYSLARYNLALILLKSGDEGRAMEEIHRAAETDPGYVDPHFKLGLYYNTRGKPEEAVAELRKALRGHGDAAVIHDYIGTIYLEQGRREEAAKEFSLSLEANPRYSEGYNKLGVLRAQAGDQQGARRLFIKAISLDPLNAMAHSNLGSTYLQVNDGDSALRHYAEALRIAPGLDETRNLMAVVYERRGELRKAAECRRRALEAAPAENRHEGWQ